MKMRDAKSILGVSFLLVIVFFANSYVFGQLTEIENRIPKNVPVKVEIKNQDSENWVHDLEILVTNTGKKPIYFLSLFLILDIKADNGDQYGFHLYYGNKELVSTEKLAEEGNSSIFPNETYTFKVRKDSADALIYRKSLGNFTEPRTANIKLSWLSFGDGTGIKSGGTPYKKKSGRKHFQ